MEQEELTTLDGIYSLSFDDWSTWCETQKSSDKFFGKMRRGIIDDNCHHDMVAYYDNGNILGVVATKYYKKYANLKWIVTSPEARGKGVFRSLCEYSVKRANMLRLNHFRVSINPPALEAYQRVGFKTWGVQKSDCLLSIGKLNGNSIKDMLWEWDEYTEKEVTKTGMGGCVKDYWNVARGL